MKNAKVGNVVHSKTFALIPLTLVQILCQHNDFLWTFSISQPDLFPAYGENSIDNCGAMCANTAGCYLWNWNPNSENCSITVGMKPGFAGIKECIES